MQRYVALARLLGQQLSRLGGRHAGGLAKGAQAAAARKLGERPLLLAHGLRQQRRGFVEGVVLHHQLHHGHRRA
jgi:hypothetical protein